jgi:hypothetical protein
MNFTEEYVICKQCKGPFKDQNEYENHVKRHSGDKKEDLTCEKCQQNFTNQTKLNIHLWRHLGVLSCAKCDEKFKSLADLKAHKETGHQKSASLTNNEVRPTKLKSKCNREKEVRIKFECNFCGMKLSTLRYWKKHSKLHIKTDFLRCQYCPQKFKYSRLLK